MSAGALKDGDARWTPGAPGAPPRAVRLWLYGVAALIVLMVAVGGATRLTESGLSITEWKPVTGALPPLSEGEWRAEFEKYKAIPQYEILNAGMGLEGFKRIFWWEWAHRLLGRLIGLAFFLPFLVFLWRGALRGRLLVQCLGLFALGALQGAVGWWMVASGLTARISVSQYRLAVHLTLASVILSAMVAVARAGARVARQALPPRLRWSAYGLLALVLVQIFAGALVAGLNAGLAYNDWPFMGGVLVPPLDMLASLGPLWRNLFENTLTVQFDHRLIAYTLWVFALLHALDASRTTGSRIAGPARREAWGLFALVSLQAALGIATLRLSVPLPVALAHQLGAMAVLIAATIHAVDLTPRRERAGLSSPAEPPPAPSAR